MTEQNNLLDELRCLKTMLTAEQARAISLQSALDLKTDQLRAAELDRDYFRNIASDLVAKAEAIETLAHGITESAKKNARLLMIEPPVTTPGLAIARGSVEEELAGILSSFQPEGGRAEAA